MTGADSSRICETDIDAPCSIEVKKMSWLHLDKQLARFSDRLVSDVRIEKEEAKKIATLIAGETRFLPPEIKSAISDASPVSILNRRVELEAFQRWSELAAETRDPAVVRAHVLTQNYICFVYLPESCFSILYKNMPSGSLTRRCSNYLTSSRVRSFRNAIAHANWSYRDDFEAIEFWARKGSVLSESLSKFEVDNDELQFWQALSKCVAYTVISNLASNE